MASIIISPCHHYHYQINFVNAIPMYNEFALMQLEGQLNSLCISSNYRFVFGFSNFATLRTTLNRLIHKSHIAQRRFTIVVLCYRQYVSTLRDGLFSSIFPFHSPVYQQANKNHTSLAYLKNGNPQTQWQEISVKYLQEASRHL